MIYGRPPRAYAQIDGRWCHIYTVKFYTQVDIFGENVQMCSFLIGKNGKELHELPIERLENKKPVQRRTKQDKA